MSNYFSIFLLSIGLLLFATPVLADYGDLSIDADTETNEAQAPDVVPDVPPVYEAGPEDLPGVLGTLDGDQSNESEAEPIAGPDDLPDSMCGNLASPSIKCEPNTNPRACQLQSRASETYRINPTLKQYGDIGVTLPSIDTGGGFAFISRKFAPGDRARGGDFRDRG